LLLQGRILVPKARALLERIFDGKLTATPVETEDGPRFLVEGVASLSKMLALEGEVGQQKPTVKFASPGGFERYRDASPIVAASEPIAEQKADSAKDDEPDASTIVDNRGPVKTEVEAAIRPLIAATLEPSAAELRAKLDRAIMAEQWEAVRAIRDRIVEVERVEAANVIDFVARRRARE
jgi:hypothetical protein